MGPKRLVWQLFLSYLLVTLISLLAVTWYAITSTEKFYLKQTASDLENRARLLENYLRPQYGKESRTIDRLCKEMGIIAATRFTVVLPSGEVLGDTYEDPGRMDNHGDRPEIQTALKGGVGVSTRYSYTRRQQLIYVAVPWLVEGNLVGAVRASLPLGEIAGELKVIYGNIALGALVIALVMGILSIIISRRFTKPLEELERGARRFAQGRLDRKLSVPPTFELANLAEAMNQMATQLEERLHLLTMHSREHEAILAAMVEGVLAFDQKGYLLTLNKAAAQMLGINPEALKQRHLREVLQNPDLRWFVNRLLTSPEPLQEEISLKGNGSRFLQVQGRALRDPDGGLMGNLVVLQDITHLRRLETARRDFVANVSHELKTPVTSIKGYVETLLAGALKEPENAERFLRIIAQQADRLHDLIEDLLSLSRIEQDAERHRIALSRDNVKKVLEAARQVCAAKAASKNIKVEVVCSDHLRASFNAPLLEQALVNLLDNAIKFSPEGATVRMEAEIQKKELIIRVKDWGSGISPEHLDRIFERFYRVDAGRSRKEGGTGLGLAIVKHIAQAHRGQVQVSSIPGQGSTFTLVIPED
uniref:histidine kinase n=1 Tax=Desulfobacca acetoxidans TaxID=60893 RepID=A0A7C5ENY3_9BACT